MKLFTAAQKNYLLFRKLEIGNVYMLPQFGFMAYAEPNTRSSSYVDTNPFTKSLDYHPVELIALQDGIAKVKFIHSLKGKRPEFWIKSFDLEYRGNMEHSS